MSISYKTNNLLIDYHNNSEYRNILRTVFNMKPNPNTIAIEHEPTDEETEDDFYYNETIIMSEMQLIYEHTEHNVLFQELYDLSAAKMFSVDRTIGVCILFSYDYFYLFHACLCVFLLHPLEFTNLCKYYIQLKMELEKR